MVTTKHLITGSTFTIPTVRGFSRLCQVYMTLHEKSVSTDKTILDFYSPVNNAALSTTSDVATFQLELDKPIDFIAGQYLLLRLPGMEGYRPYSMTSFDANTRQAKFVIKRFPGGRFSEALFAGGAAEYRVDVFGPMGLATFDPGENRDLVCLVGGSGIAGIMSILSQAASLDYFKKHRLTIVFGVRRLEDFFFIEELKVVQKSAPEHIQIHLF